MNTFRIIICVIAFVKVVLHTQLISCVVACSGSVEGSGNTNAKELSCISFIDHKEGETCSSIAQEFNLTLDEFIGFNPNLNCNKIFVGEWLCLNAA